MSNPLLSAFLLQCSTAPDNIALMEDERQLSYKQLLQQVNLLSSQLQSGNYPVQRTIIAIDRGIDATVAILASLQAGICYIPLDLKNPASRLNYIINDADVQYIIGKGLCPDWIELPDLWLNIELLPETTSQQPASVTAETLATILYTSGSTGSPKGVALSHRAIHNFSNWAANTFNINNNECSYFLSKKTDSLNRLFI